MSEEKELATTIAQLDVHPDTLRDSVGKIEAALALWRQPKADIDDLNDSSAATCRGLSSRRPQRVG